MGPDREILFFSRNTSSLSGSLVWGKKPWAKWVKGLNYDKRWILNFWWWTCYSGYRSLNKVLNTWNLYNVTSQCSVQSLSRVRLCDPMDHSMPGLLVHHQLLEFTQTYLHWVGDAIQPSYPLSSPSPPALNLSQHQGLFKWVSSSHQVAKVLEFQLQHQSF